ncbi:MAG: hypothetical protein FWG10_02880 [Eubacteriaceae bacterium]|nr:hypothetical protein [Eubacteriaceae bacterium]
MDLQVHLAQTHHQVLAQALILIRQVQKAAAQIQKAAAQIQKAAAQSTGRTTLQKAQAQTKVDRAREF